MRTEIEVGQRFGKWTVIDSTPVYTTGGQRNVKVQCECGKIEYKHWSSLRLGKTTQNRKCAITGDELPNILRASLDRIDSSKGYIEGNVQWVTAQANKCKHILSMSELYEFAQKVLNHANQQPSQSLTTLKGSETNP